MKSGQQIPKDWIEGAAFTDEGDVVSPPFDDDENFCAWWVFARVRAHCQALGTDYPRDPLRAALYAACEWTRIREGGATRQ